MKQAKPFSIFALMCLFPWRVGLTLVLVLLETVATLLFPLAIGLAVDGLIQGKYGGLITLGGLSLAALFVGSGRRFYDTRVYSDIYQRVAFELVSNEYQKRTPVSAIAARTSLLNELVEFLENSMPMLVNGVVALVGTLLILAGIDLTIFFAALGLSGVVLAVYWASAGKNHCLTKEYNDELEEQVSALGSRDSILARGHFRRLMIWNRRLSDLETLNYFVICFAAIGLLVYSAVAVVSGAEPQYGIVLATLMYVFQYIESVLEMPLFIQQGIRLNEISVRLGANPETEGLST